MKPVVEVRHTKDRFDNACGYTSKFESRAVHNGETANKRGYWKCRVCNEPMHFLENKKLNKLFIG